MATTQESDRDYRYQEAASSLRRKMERTCQKHGMTEFGLAWHLWVQMRNLVALSEA